MNYILLLIVIISIITLLLRTIMNRFISMTNFKNVKPIIDVHEATYSEIKIPQETNGNSSFTSYTFYKPYIGNDLVKNIMKKDYKNIEYKTSNLGDSCEISKDCPDGLSCVFDGRTKFCAKEIPLLKCKGLACDQKKHNLGENCGESVDSSILQILCDESKNLKCMSGDFRNNVIGTCSNII